MRAHRGKSEGDDDKSWFQEMIEHDQELILFVATLYVIWIAVVVLTNIIGQNSDLTDDAALLVASGGVLTLFLGQRRTHRKLDKVYEHVNNVEANEACPDGDGEKTLGQVMRSVQREMRAGFVKNDETHALIQGEVENVGRVLDAHEERLNAQRDDIDRLTKDKEQ